MALKDLKSDLKDLSFRKGTAYDRPDQGFSLEPFIKGGINLGGTSTLNTITGGFIRGGALMHIERKLQDTVRFGKFLITPRGITWNLKQLGLQKSNPKISKPSIKDLFGSPANQRQWNFGINTLAQVVGQGTGLHIKREGLTPLDGSGYIDEEKFLANYKQGNNTNKLLYLYDDHISTPPPPDEPLTNQPKEKKTKLGKFIQETGQKIKAAFTNDTAELYSYNGGPGSTYGLGKTNIYKYSNTNFGGELRFQGTKNIGFDGSGGNREFFNTDILWRKPSDEDLDELAKRDNNYQYISYSPGYGLQNMGIPDIKDYHTIFDDHNDTTGKDGRINPRIKNYLHTLGRISKDNYNIKFENGAKTYHRESRVNLGNPGGDPTAAGNTTVDLINALDVFESGGFLDHNAIRDLIRFRIEAVDPVNPTQSNVMVFRAFLDGLNDSFNANYNEFTYNGRGENFYTYAGFNRDISFSFKIAAQSSKEMKPLYRKLNYLLSNTTPEYHGTSGRMMTPFMRLTIGAYFDRLPGVIKNVGITWQKDYPWEITVDAPEGGSTSGLFVLPHVLDINVTYQPIHDFLPQKGIDSPFIIPHEGSAIANTDGRKLWNSEGISKTIWKTKIEDGEEVRELDEYGSPIVKTEGIDIAIAKRAKQTTN